jgi:hypothetical protein
MKSADLLVYVSIFLIAYILFMDKQNVNETFIDGIKLIVTKDDAINYLSNIVKNSNGELNLTNENATHLYEKLFEDKTDNDIYIYKIFNDLSYLSKNNSQSNDNIYYNKTYLALCDIINNRGIYNNLPWFGNNAMSIPNVKVITKNRLKYIYNFNAMNNIDFIGEFDKYSNNYYISCDIADIIRYNKFYCNINCIIKRHPVLNAYSNKLYDIFGNIQNKTKSDLINLNVNVDEKLTNLTPNDGDNNFMDLIKKSIKNTLFTTYDNNLTINQLFDLPQFNHDKNNFIGALINIMNDLTLFITPNYDYNDEFNKDNLLNGTIGRLNETILNIRYNRDLNYLRNNLWVKDKDDKIIIVNGKKVPIIDDVVMVNIMNILYKYYVNISLVSQDSISNMILNIKNQKIVFPSFDDRLAYIIQNINDIMLDEMLSLEGIIDCKYINSLIKHFRALITLNHQNIPNDMVNYKVNKYMKIGELSDILFYGIY